MRYVEFPHDVDIDILVNDCARRNRNGEQLSNEGFQQASELLPVSGSDGAESTPIPIEVDVALADLEHRIVEESTDLLDAENVNDSPRLIVRVWRWIVTFLRKTSL